MITDRDVARCMVEYGGSFVAKLGSAALAAETEAYWAKVKKHLK